MQEKKPTVYILNIDPQNWEECLREHHFGFREDSRRPRFQKGDICLVRRTGKQYGVMGIWIFESEEHVDDPSTLPWNDAEYTWHQSFKPIVDFSSPMSEEFSGTSKFSEKIQIPAMRIVGSAIKLNEDEINKYLGAVLSEKSTELGIMVNYAGTNRTARSIIEEINQAKTSGNKTPQPPPTTKGLRDNPVGEPINFRGMVYAPLNEAGVVLLFSKVMNDLGIIYESSPLTGFDMVGRIKTQRGFERKNIEFEYRSSNFKLHGHDPAEVDYIVCWVHDWIDCPSYIEVIELGQVIKELPATFS